MGAMGAMGGGARRRIAVWSAAGAVLLPLVAMRLGAPGMHWTGSDFAAMGALRAATCGMWEAGSRMSGDRAYRGAVAIAALAGLLLVWVNLAWASSATKAIPRPDVRRGLAIGIAGAPWSRFRAAGMARLLSAMAAAQALAGVVALAVYRVGVVETVAAIVFVAAWLASAALFRRAARRTA